MSNGGRIAVLAAIIAVAVGVLVIAKGGDEETKSTTTATPSTATSTTSTTTATPAGPPVFRVTVSGGKPAGGIKNIKVGKGDQVNLVVKSDVADQIHIHAYDLMKDVEAGGTVRFEFKATIDGSFEIELEDAKEQIATLTVEP